MCAFSKEVSRRLKASVDFEKSHRENHCFYERLYYQAKVGNEEGVGVM